MRKAKVKDARPKKIFLVWRNYSTDACYANYGSLELAVSAHPKEEIYQATVKPIGKFKKVTTLEKIEEKRGPGRPKGTR